MEQPLTLSQAQRRIGKLIAPTGVESLPLGEACGRVAASAISAREDSPPFAKSAYDGYAVGPENVGDDAGEVTLHIAGEIAAGGTAPAAIAPGTAIRIMTGAPLPRAAVRVIPQEYCGVAGETLTLAAAALRRGPSGIHARGAFIRKGSLLAGCGTCLNPGHLGRLAEAGLDSVEVRRRPRVGIFCSGSELTALPRRREGSETISSNRFLLAGLLGENGCRLVDYGIAGDSVEALATTFGQACREGVDVLISTGGTGAGKYDLLREVVRERGGTMVFSSLRLRPGKSAFCTLLGSTLHFALPGPPAAVQPLFQVLILPALRALQGRRPKNPPLLKARLSEDIDLGRSGPMMLCEAVLGVARGRCEVRPVRRGEAADCYLRCPPGRRRIGRGTLLGVVPMSGCRFSL